MFLFCGFRAWSIWRWMGGTVEQVRYVQFEVVQIEPILEAGEEGFGAVSVHFQKRQ